MRSTLSRERVRSREMELLHEHQEVTKLRDQKRDLESIIENQLGFIDKLVKDKKDLNDQCDAIMKQYSLMEEKHAR